MRNHLDESKRPDYVVHVVDEKDVTIDWFFGDRPLVSKVPQLVLALCSWIFAVLPVVITVDAEVHERDTHGWWHYHEGFVMFAVTMTTLGILLVFFLVAFLALYFLARWLRTWHTQTTTYDEERLSFRIGIAAQLYADKYGPPDYRKSRRNVLIEPYDDFETYELRGRYRDYDVGVE